MRKVAIQGIAGSYHDVAAHRYFEDEPIELVPCETFKELVRKVASDERTVGIMAIENTIAGSLLQNHELIRQSGCVVTGEYKLRIMHSLATLPGTKMSDLTEIHSHPIALMQCDDFLVTIPYVKLVETDDTAGSLSKVLTILSFYDMNLSKIQSLPIIGHEWEYLFYINLTFSDYPLYKQALDAITPLTKDLKILGEYAEGKQGI